jgi:hypothetical protein
MEGQQGVGVSQNWKELSSMAGLLPQQRQQQRAKLVIESLDHKKFCSAPNYVVLAKVYALESISIPAMLPWCHYVLLLVPRREMALGLTDGQSLTAFIADPHDL